MEKRMTDIVEKQETITEYQHRLKKEAVLVLNRAKEMECIKLKNGWKWIISGGIKYLRKII